MSRPTIVLGCSQSSGGLGIDVVMNDAPVLHCRSMATVLHVAERLREAGIYCHIVQGPSLRELAGAAVDPTRSEASIGSDRDADDGPPQLVGALAFGVDPYDDDR